ncbi:glycosyltransferase family 2 protein [Croceicoccus sp. F390]|uniref:Glycosyltransferase family 2 protein n=1 Tax=Croceicoccus esteveae TaxID=3075597 RepID=A0ABU2ZL02_9SPHN|nr:glycosyltransferase family 2 protein [Croceicoccus sp. F390]MDT0576107.1 glycosyltransferase family 2 protein [Croceicoccus sp. F390]
MDILTWFLVCLFIGVQVLYLLAMLVDVYFYSRPVNRVDISLADGIAPGELPHIVLLYPVLNEPEETMRTTFHSLARIDYPEERRSIVAIPNHDDHATIASLRQLAKEFAFLSIMEVPPTTAPEWQTVWSAWDSNPHVYWYHKGPRAGVRDLPAKKTRQLIYAFYQIHKERAGDFLLNYIDADSAPLPDHFLAGAAGVRQYDVTQSTNIAGNLLNTLPASWFAFDHIVWDANKYGHLTADGTHPYWVLGKGLFFKASDLYALGGFHPWVAIEDPEVGMRFWKNGKTLGLIEAPLVEEVPQTFGNGLKQRKRWVAGFFQSLNVPLKEMGFTRTERIKAWLNFLPCMSLSLNSIGIPLGVWAAVTWWLGTSPLPEWTLWLALVNAIALTIMFVRLYYVAWTRTRIVLPGALSRLWYLLRVNPLFLLVFWFIWIIPLWQGWRTYRKDRGLEWERTDKLNANDAIIRRNRLSTDRVQ